MKPEHVGAMLVVVQMELTGLVCGCRISWLRTNMSRESKVANTSERFVQDVAGSNQSAKLDAPKDPLTTAQPVCKRSLLLIKAVEIYRIRIEFIRKQGTFPNERPISKTVHDNFIDQRLATYKLERQ